MRILNYYRNGIDCVIKDYYKCSYAKARDYVTLLNDSQLDILRKHSDKGGLKGKK